MEAIRGTDPGPWSGAAPRRSRGPCGHYRGPGMSVHRHPGRDDGRLRATSWRGDPTVAQVVVRARVTDAEVRALLDELRSRGCTAVVTAALAPPEQQPFLAAGFEEHERLHLLRRDVAPLPARPDGVTLRRARPADHPEVLAVDHLAFPPFWRFDEAALEDALDATPAVRFRVALRPGTSAVAGYAVTGRAGGRGYLQRLAVHPECQRRGLGTALVADGLRWLRRWGAREVLVNTQEANAGALALYEALGFARQPHGLAVLRRALAVGTP